VRIAAIESLAATAALERFDVILDRVAAVTRDPALADQAARYKAGL
jgi:hypothetical protein